MRIELDEARRLTGPNLLWQHPGGIIDVFIEDLDKEKVVSTWQNWMAKILPFLGWEHQETTYRMHKHGASMALSAPMDALYTACEAMEYAWQLTESEFTGADTADWDSSIAQLQQALKDEVNPKLIALLDAAAEHGVTAVSDDDYLSFGMGSTCDTWAIDALPNIDEVNWSQYRDIPIALITGTNGKSTSVRLASEIAKAAEINAGVTSTDFIRVGEDIIDRGDYSGPGGARILIRDERTDVAFLEVARGGILRRGLPILRANAALITNVASDHLGQYGVDTVEELAAAKFVVAKAIDERGTLVLNADNDLVVNQAKQVSCPICWFSEDVNNPLVSEQKQQGKPAVYCLDGNLVYFDGNAEQVVCEINAVPMTFSGSARHNVQNALGVVGLSFALGLDSKAIVAGLMNFGSNAQDNPGRGNQYQVKGATFIVDFAHNEHSMKAVVAMAKNMPARRKIVMFSHAGDRSNQEIADLTTAVADLQADIYITAELERYLRGREAGEVPALTQGTLVSHGISKEKILFAESPVAGTQIAIQEARQGDTILLFALDQRDAVAKLLESS